MQRDGQFDRAEAGREMTAHLAHGLDQELAQFVRDRAAAASAAAGAGRPAIRSCDSSG